MHTRSWPTSLITTSALLLLAAPAQAGTIELRSYGFAIDVHLGDGDDTLANRAGQDDLRGGAGDDRLETYDRSQVRCGPGHDRVTVSQGVPRLHADCDHAKGYGPVLRFRAGAVIPTWDRKAYPRPCRLRVTLDGRRIPAGRATRVRRPATIRPHPGGQCGEKWRGSLAGAALRLVR